jgi:PAS domain-containing protein
MEILAKSYRQSRLIRLTAGIVGLCLVLQRLGNQSHTTVAMSAASAFIWGSVFLVVLLLVWRERNHSVANRRASQENARLIGAAETSPDAFSICDSIRNATGDIVDFRYKYINSHAEELLKTPREELLDQGMCALFPLNRTSGLFDKYCKVLLSGEPLCEEYSVPLEGGKQMWLRQRVVKLGDGVAITTSDALPQPIQLHHLGV